jgi:uncharacterized protein DUF4326
MGSTEVLPKRIQLRRTKGWRKPDGAVVVSRPSKWGNPFSVEGIAVIKGGGIVLMRGRADAAGLFGLWLTDRIALADPMEDRRQWMRDNAHLLRGKDLACWCPLGEPCHADVLLEMANR